MKRLGLNYLWKSRYVQVWYPNGRLTGKVCHNTDHKWSTAVLQWCPDLLIRCSRCEGTRWFGTDRCTNHHTIMTISIRIVENKMQKKSSVTSQHQSNNHNMIFFACRYLSYLGICDAVTKYCNKLHFYQHCSQQHHFVVFTSNTDIFLTSWNLSCTHGPVAGEGKTVVTATKATVKVRLGFCTVTVNTKKTCRSVMAGNSRVLD